MSEGSVVLLSGGMDSGVAALLAADAGPVHALTIEYGQRHQIEIGAAKRIAGIVGAASHITTHLGAQGVGLPSALTSRVPGPVIGVLAIVPGRNLLFLTLASARAQSLGATRVVIGCCGDDAAVFPDCRPAFLLAAQAAIRLALDYPALSIVAPFVDRTKGQIILAARAFAKGADVLAASWSCYSPVGPVGREEACGACSACIARARGFDDAHRAIPLEAG